MRGPKRASKIRKLFNLEKDDDVRPPHPRPASHPSRASAPARPAPASCAAPVAAPASAGPTLPPRPGLRRFAST